MIRHPSTIAAGMAEARRRLQRETHHIKTGRFDDDAFEFTVDPVASVSIASEYSARAGQPLCHAKPNRAGKRSAGADRDSNR